MLIIQFYQTRAWEGSYPTSQVKAGSDSYFLVGVRIVSTTRRRLVDQVIGPYEIQALRVWVD